MSRVHSKTIIAGSVFLLLLAGCQWLSLPTPTPHTLPAPPTALATPTPHYAPLEGEAYVVAIRDLPANVYEAPARTLIIKGQIPGGTRVEIIESVWNFWQNEYAISACYFYHVRVPGTDREGWMDQNNLVAEPNTFTPDEYRCIQGDGPTPTPVAIEPLRGSVYINVPEAIGVPGSNYPNMPIYTQRIYTRGVSVWALQSLWIYRRPNQEFPAGIACYVYYVRLADEMEGQWLPEDVLSTSLETPPRPTCFQGQIPSWFVDLSLPVPRNYEVIAP